MRPLKNDAVLYLRIPQMAKRWIDRAAAKDHRKTADYIRMIIAEKMDADREAQLVAPANEGDILVSEVDA